MAHLFGLARIGKDAEIRKVGGESVCNLSLAFSYYDKDAENSRGTQWVDGSLWGKRATSLQQYIFKGSRVQVGGPIKLDDYQAKDGTTKQALRLSIDQIDLPPRPAQDQGSYQQQEQQPQSRPAPQPRQAAP